MQCRGGGWGAVQCRRTASCAAGQRSVKGREPSTRLLTHRRSSPIGNRITETSPRCEQAMLTWAAAKLARRTQPPCAGPQCRHVDVVSSLQRLRQLPGDQHPTWQTRNWRRVTTWSRFRRARLLYSSGRTIFQHSIDGPQPELTEAAVSEDR